MNILYYDCFSGISGDMNLGAMVDLGVDPTYLKDELRKLNISGYNLEISKSIKRGIEGTRVNVALSNFRPQKVENVSFLEIKPQHEHVHRNLAEIEKIINLSTLSEHVKQTSLKIFEKVALAEAKIHGKTLREVHFHEVGAVDSIVDIVGAAICFDFLKPDKIICSRVEVGSGMVKCAHGLFPVPAPATAEILKNIPLKTGGVPFEATTPTGAAILSAMVNEFTDKTTFRIKKTGYGIGFKDADVPNVLRVYMATDSDDETIKQASLIECNIDDMNPEFYGFIMEQLFAKGADDVYITPIIMKKGRPASILSVICDKSLVDELSNMILTHTTTLGLRVFEFEKVMLHRETETITTQFGTVRVKWALLGNKRIKSKPEYSDCMKLAKDNHITLKEIYSEVEYELSKRRNNG